MLAKCIWKMYQKPVDDLDERDKIGRPTLDDVIEALEKTVEVVSLLPKPRHGQDPVLEPHYKILSIVHKLVTRGEMPAQDGADILQRQPYAIQRGEEVKVNDAEDWEGYMIKYLRHLRDKDKSNWQHRIIIRHARILFDFDVTADPDSPTAVTNGDSFVRQAMRAKAAFSVLRESMFTKTMVMNVWKCDAERPGRHHVYTDHYVRLMTRLLVLMNDRANLEALLRRIRKKGADFYHFNDLWQTCVLCYVKLLRQTFRVPSTEEDVYKNVSPDEFEILAERITEWVGQPGVEHTALSAMKEAIELKKLNANLMKAAPIDDLINDCYSVIFTEVSRDLPGEDPLKIIEERQKLREELERAEKAPATDLDTAARDANLLNGLNVPLDGGNDTSRAGSEAPEKMEKQASGMGTEHPVRRGRAAGVRRQDVMRKAEQAVLALTEPPPPKSAVSASSRGEGRKSRMGSTSSGKNGATPNGDADGHESENGGEDDDTEMKDAATAENEQQDGDEGGSSDASSPPGSVHDSADDESDLSDVPPDYEDNAPPSLLFPNLRRSVDAGTAGEEDSAAQSSADEEASSPVGGDESEMVEDEGDEAEEAEEGDDDDDGDQGEGEASTLSG